MVAAAIAGGALASGVIGAAATKSAAGTQAQGTADALAEQQREYDTSMGLQQNAISTGDTARNKLAGLLGLNTTGTAAGFDGAAYLAANPDVAANATFAANPYQHYTEYGQAEGRAYTPTANASGTDSASSVLASDPGYAFRLQQGQQAIDNKAAAGGSYFSGAALKAASAYNSGQASQEYGNYVNQLSSLAGAGQTASNAASNTASTYGTNVANTTTAGANAQAASTIAGGNALTGSINSGLNGYYQNNLLTNLLAKQNGASAGISNYYGTDTTGGYTGGMSAYGG